MQTQHGPPVPGNGLCNASVPEPEEVTPSPGAFCHSQCLLGVIKGRFLCGQEAPLSLRPHHVSVTECEHEHILRFMKRWASKGATVMHYVRPSLSLACMLASP